MSTFHSLKVSDVRRETPEAVSVAFEIPDSLQSKFQFKQGQYITLKKAFDGEEARRSYSVCVGPNDGELRVAIKEVPGGLFSTYANRELSIGDELEVMEPTGRFYTDLDSSTSRSYVAFAAGSGITPVISNMKAVLEEEPNSRFTLFFGNKSQETIIFKREIEGLKNKYMDRVAVYHVISRENLGIDIFHGRIDEEKVKIYCDGLIDTASTDHYFLCGPEEMINTVRTELESRGVDKAKIHFELFAAPSDPKAKKELKQTEVKELDSALTVILDGEENKLDLSSKGQSILDAALNSGMDVPYACKGAVCMTCKAKVLKGEVRMDMNYALTDDEVEEGYVLTCQSHPTSEEAVVSYDD